MSTEKEIYRDMLTLARRLRECAYAEDAAYVATADPRAVQGGARSGDAIEIERFERRVMKLAQEWADERSV